MASNPYLNIPNDSVVGILTGDRSQSLVLRKKLQGLGLKNFKEFVHGSEALHALSAGSIHFLYLVGRPADMDPLTFVRAARSGPVFSSKAIVMLAARDSHLTADELGYLQAYKVTVLHCQPNDTKEISASLRDVFQSKDDKRSIQSRLEHAKQVLQSGLNKAAEDIYQQLVQDFPGNIVARVGLARAAAGDPVVHLERLKSLLEQDPKNYNFRFELIERLLQDGQLAQAKAHLDDLIAELEANKEVFWLNELGVLCVRLKLFAFCLKIIERLKAIVADHQTWLVDLLTSRTHLASGNDLEATRHLNRAEKNAPKGRPEIENLRAILARKAGNFDAAITYYSNALALSPEDHRIAYNLGLCYEKQGNSREALKYFKLAAKLSPGFSRVSDRLEEDPKESGDQ